MNLYDHTFTEVSYNNKKRIAEDSKFVDIINDKNQTKVNAAAKKKEKAITNGCKVRKSKELFKNQLMLRRVEATNIPDKYRHIVVFMYNGTDEEKAGRLSINILGTVNTDEIYFMADLIIEHVLKPNLHIICADFDRSTYDPTTKQYKFEDGAIQYIQVVDGDENMIQNLCADDIDIIFDNIIVNFKTNSTINLSNLEAISDDKFKFMMNDPKTNTVRFKYLVDDDNDIHVHFKRTGKCNLNRIKSIHDAQQALLYIYDLFQKDRYILQKDHKDLDELNSMELDECINDVVSIMAKYRNVIGK